MILIACVDLNMGMLFNNRRQSRDRKLIASITQLVGDKKLWITEFSRKMFEKELCHFSIMDENFWKQVGKDDFCFIEDIYPLSLEKKTDKIILYNWNRVYPASRYFNIPLKNWQLESETELEGSSHEKITQRIYRRTENA